MNKPKPNFLEYWEGMSTPVDCNDYDDDGNVINIVDTAGAEVADIHTIVARAAFGALPEGNTEYGDASNATLSFHERQTLLAKAKTEFAELPVEQRAKYNGSFQTYIKARYKDSLQAVGDAITALRVSSEVEDPQDPDRTSTPPTTVDDAT